MIKKTLIITASFILAGYLYSVYCERFWYNYRVDHKIYDASGENYERTDFSFKPIQKIPSDTTLNKENFWKYTWNRALIESHHGQWIDDIELSFPNDSTLNQTLRCPYILDIYWTYPLLRTYIGEFNLIEKTYKFNNESMSFVTDEKDTVMIIIQNNNLIINRVYL
jgi:hypothetical protein